MQLKRIQIGGFGGLRNWESETLSPRINLIVGPNEAGKSTVFAFVQTLLYGFSPKNAKHPYRPAFGENEFGGQIEVDWNGESYRLSRYLKGSRDLAVLRDASGNPVDYGECPGQALLQVSSAIFTNVFSISLSELKNFERSEQTEVSPYLLGLTERTSESVNPRQILTHLEYDANALAKTPGNRRRRPRRSEALKEKLKAARDALRQQREEAENSRVCSAELEQLKKTIDALRERESELLREQKRSVQYQQALDIARKVAEMERELEGERELLDFPLELDREVERLDERLQNLANQNERERIQLEHVDEEIQAITIDEKFLNVRERLDSHLRRLEWVKDSRTEIEDGERAVEEKHARLEEELIRCRMRGDTDTAQGSLVQTLRERIADGSQPNDRESLQQLEAVTAASQTVQRCEADLERQRKRVEESEAEHSGILTTLPAEPEAIRGCDDPSVLLELRQKFEARERLAGDIAKAKANRESLRERIRECESEREEQQAEIQSLYNKQKRWMLLGVAAVLAVLAISAGLDYRTAGVLTLSLQTTVMAGFGLLGLALQASILSSRFIRSRDRLNETIEPRLDELRDQIAEAESEDNTSMDAFGECCEETDKKAFELNLPRPLTMEVLDEKLEIARRQNRARTELARLDQAASLLETLKTELERAQRKLTDERERLQTLQEEARGTLAAWNLPEEMTPDEGMRAIRTVAHVSRELHEQTDIERRIERKRRDLELFLEETNVLLEELGEPVVETPEALAPALERLRRKSEAQVELERKIAERRRHREAIVTGLTALHNQRQKAIGELNADLQKAGCERIETFRQDLEAARRIRNVQDRLKDRQQDLNRYGMAEDALEQARAEALGQGEEIETVGPPDAGQEAAIDVELTRVKDEVERLALQCGNLERQLADYRARVDIAGAESLVLSLEEERRKIAQEFDVLQVAHRLLAEAIERFRKAHQPNVFQRAGTFFKTMTQGKYAQVVVADPDATTMGLEVIPTEPGPAWKASQLSRGTREQLYLSLRLALAEEIAGKGEPVPLFFDDLLVNFDRERLDATCEILEQVGRETQIFLFTCHRWMSDRVRERLNPNIIELGAK